MLMSLVSGEIDCACDWWARPTMTRGATLQSADCGGIVSGPLLDPTTGNTAKVDSETRMQTIALPGRRR